MQKILSVDDSAVMRKIIRASIESLGFELLEAKDGQEALTILNLQYPEVILILLDWNMPVMNGYEFLTHMKSIDKLKHIKVMMVTTESEKANVVKAIQAGASHYIVKPFTQELLALKINEALHKGA